MTPLAPARQPASLRGPVFPLLAGLVFVIPWEGMVWFKGVGSLPKAVGVVVIAVAALELIRHGRVRGLVDPHVLLLAFAGWAAVSYFWSIEPDRTFDQLLTVGQLAAMVLLVWEFTDGRLGYRVLLGAFVSGCAVVAGATIIGYATGTVDLDRYTASEAVHPNAVGFVVGLAIPFAWYLWATTERPWLRRLFALYLPVAVVAVVLTGSRGGAVTTMIALLVVPFTARALPSSGRVALVVGVGTCVVLLPSVLPEGPVDRLSTTSDEIEGGDLNGRRELWDAATEIFWDRPVGGVGAGASRFAIEPLTGRQAGAHNSFLSIAAELGTVGLALFGLLLLAVGRRTISLGSLEGRTAAITIVALVAGLTIRHWEYDKPTWLTLALLIGLATTRTESPTTPLPAEAVAA